MNAHFVNFISLNPSDKPLVLLMCGVAGSGKTTLAVDLEKRGFVRLSIDEEIWLAWGKYGIDYPAEMYEDFQRQAELKLQDELRRLLKEKYDVVVDFSFWQQQQRMDYKTLIESFGAIWKLIYLKVDPVVLRKRLHIRNKRFDANAAFAITEAMLSTFLNDFEVPTGEGEIVLEVGESPD